MNAGRRRFLAVLATGSLGLGSALGSSAYTQTEVSRDYDIAVVPDDDAQLAIRPGDTETDAVSVGDGVLTVDIDAANKRANTLFRDAIEIENQNQSGESVFLYTPRSVDIVGDSLEPTSDAGHESVEFLVEDRGDSLDISLPPEYPNGAFGDGKGENAGPRGRKVLNTGAVELAHEESVQVSLTVLVTLDDLDEFGGRILRVAAQRAEPDEDDWDDVGALENLAPGDVLDSR